jgi:N-acetylglucosamine-6-sulfatase
MPKTKAKMADMGATATNFFIHTPICCPSRSELISGRYFHNIKTNHAPACMHVNENLVNNNTFAKYLAEAGYTGELVCGHIKLRAILELTNACVAVGMFGKYLNNVPTFRPVGFDQWMANGGGTYIAPSFQMYDIPSVPESAGKLYSWHGTNAAGNYSTSVIGNMSMAFIRKSVAEQKPFMAYIAPKAAHEPFNPAPWYVGHWDDSWPAQEPRPPNWNASFESMKDHHGNIATEPLITDAEAAVITGVFKDRWRTLMSVDDVIGDVIDLCEELKVADNTYFLCTIRPTLSLTPTHLIRCI